MRQRRGAHPVRDVRRIHLLAHVLDGEPGPLRRDMRLLAHVLDGEPGPPRIKSGAGFRRDMRLLAHVLDGERPLRRDMRYRPASRLPGRPPLGYLMPGACLGAGGRRQTVDRTGPATGCREVGMRDIGHFIGGAEVKGKSGRAGDVFNPNTGEVQARVALAAKSEVEQAIANAAAAQPEWAATNPQRRARVMFKFLDLVNKEYDSLAALLSSEHGKTFADARGDIQRGLEVVEFACGIPHLLKGELSEGAGPGIDLFSMRQPLGVVAGITPFNFPAMIPLWKAAPALACGNCFILKPSERDPSVPMRIAELFLKAGLPPGVLNVVNGDKEAVDTLLTDPRVKAVGFVGSSSIAEYIYATGTAHGKRVQCFGGAKNHMIVMPDADMDQAVDALIGAGYGSAGERCMAVSVAVPVGKKTADILVEKLIPRVEGLKIGPSTDTQADYGPMVTKQLLDKVRGYIDQGVKEGAKLVVDGRNFKLQG